MKKQKKRMDLLDIRMVVEELGAWAEGKRGRKLSWNVLERIFPYTRQTLYSKTEIKKAYKEAKMALKMGRIAPAIPLMTESDLIIRRLKNRIKELELQIENWQKLWIEIKLTNIT